MNTRAIPEHPRMLEEATRSLLSVMGMHSNGCRERLIEALESLPGVHEVMVNLQRGRAAVSHSGLCSAEDLLDAADRAGFHASVLALGDDGGP